MKNVKRSIAVSILIGSFCVIAGSSGWAQDEYPSKTVQIVCPFPAGGAAYLAARLFAEKFSEYFKQPFIVVEKPGAGSALGAGFVAGSRPDGYTLLASTCTFSYLPVMNPTLTYRLSNFSPIATFANFPEMMVAHKDLPVKNLVELIAYIKKNPGTLSYSSMGVGTLSHLPVELLKLSLGGQLDIQHVPYDGPGPALTSLLGNHSQVGMLPFSSLVVKHIQSKAIKPLAVLSSKRSPFLPDAPTAVEQGFPDLVAEIYFVFCAPGKTPAPIVKKLEGAIERALQDKTIRDKITAMDLTIDLRNSGDTTKLLEGEVGKWGAVLKKTNLILK